jgi:hypothetical protein
LQIISIKIFFWKRIWKLNCTSCFMLEQGNSCHGNWKFRNHFQINGILLKTSKEFQQRNLTNSLPNL